MNQTELNYLIEGFQNHFDEQKKKMNKRQVKQYTSLIEKLKAAQGQKSKPSAAGIIKSIIEFFKE